MDGVFQSCACRPCDALPFLPVDAKVAMPKRPSRPMVSLDLLFRRSHRPNERCQFRLYALEFRVHERPFSELQLDLALMTKRQYYHLLSDERTRLAFLYINVPDH